MKKLLLSIIIASSISACGSTSEVVDNVSQESNKKAYPKNIIMVVGDGMGPAFTTAYRYYNDDPKTDLIEETVFDRHLVGMATTYPVRISGYVTDSAAGATALASGIKTYNGAIGMDEHKQPHETVLERAKERGLKTGAVVTSQVNHATPASYLAHNESRRNYNEIADSYLDEGIKADVIFGGGWKYFIRDDRNLVEEFKNKGFQYADNYNQLSSLTNNKPALGLFADVGLPWALDDPNKSRLRDMTKAATRLLENDKGYFLLVEASQVDWAGHSNDISSAMAEMHDLAQTMEYLEDYVKSNPDTLVILTADHSTGGLSVAANKQYRWEPKILNEIKQSPTAVAKALGQTDITLKVASDLLGFELTDSELQALQQAKYVGSEKLSAYYALDKAAQEKQRKPSIKRPIYQAINKIIDVRTNTGWTTTGHTAIDVQVFAMGPAKEKFEGKIDNTDIAKRIFKLLGN